MNEICIRRLVFILFILFLIFPACANKSTGLIGAEKVSPLREAVRSDNSALVSDLISKGANINGTDSFDMTPLGIAVERQNLELVRFLIDRGANVLTGNGEYGTALHIAVRGEGLEKKPSIEIADLLISRGADLESFSGNFTPLHQAAAWNRVEMAEFLLKKGANVNSRPAGTRGDTPLHVAVIGNRSYPIAKLLIDHGADLSARGSSGDTPLHAAMINHSPSLEIVMLFLDHAADVNSRMEGAIFGWHLGDTPLHLATFLREVGIVELLLSRGADVNTKNAKGLTPVGLAKYWEKKLNEPEYKSVIELLQNSGGHD